jgi:aryl-alcohol dehydrogenase-like predicted oxidoreductase
MATQSATWAYRDDHDEFARTFFRRYADCVVSSIGVGTYLGDPTTLQDEQHEEAIVEALRSGINVVDTAINYRNQRSERVVGDAVRAADVDREAVLVATKGGFVPFDRDQPADPGQYVHDEYINTQIVDRDDLARGQHAIEAGFIDDQLDRSLANLDMDTIDLYYVHNPETQLTVRSAEAVYDQLEATFTRLEERVAAGDIRHYGVATWDAFRLPKDRDSYLSLPEIVRRARAAADAAGADATHFRAVQLPFNVQMADAFTVHSQDGPDGPQSVLSFAHEAGLDVFTSASILQGNLASGLPTDVAAKLSGDTSAQRAINFARSAPGVTCSLVGMGSQEHVEENVAAGTFEPLGADAFDAVFE